MHASPLRRLFLWTFLAGLSITALLAIAAVLSPDFGVGRGRVLGTTAAISGGSVLALACAAFRERTRIAGNLGITLAALATTLTIGVLWRDTHDRDHGRATLVVVVLATAVAHAQLMLLPRLRPSHRWAQFALVILITTLALTLVWVILGLTEHSTTGIEQLIAVQSILVALLTLAVPVLAWIHRGEPSPAAPLAASSARLVLTQANDGTWRDEQGAIYEVCRRSSNP